ncbi:uncharacterized protein OCT59_022540 [Rhizophagus irregularis]|uniref:uncharacterized protein n=1 Tax=Rhizophagus irregularis TaxID=588596 RepID=UPI0033296780|nr:hypothetical protein OCT59_022540 [Rhizophagus irregularis]
MTSQFVPKTTPLMITTKFCNTVLRNKAQARDHDNLQLEVLGRKCGTCGLRNQGARGTNLHPEGKQHQISIGFAQYSMVCNVRAPTKPTRKQKADTAFGEDYDYLYGIITTATEWYFLLYTTEGISCTSATLAHR